MSSDVSSDAAPERLPRNYLTILEAVRSVPLGTHLTAQDIFARARAQQPKLGFATVHRGLARLAELGYVVKVELPGAASAVYEPAAGPHSHFRCTACGSVRDVEFKVPHELLVALAEHHHVKIAAESTTFEGLCTNCVGG